MQACPPSLSQLSPTLFFQTVNAYQRTAVIKAAIELKFFSAIAEGNDTVASIAARCAVTPRGARILADQLTILGFLTKSSDHYTLTEDSILFLDEKSPAYAGAALEFLLSPEIMNHFSKLTDRVRRGALPENTESPFNPPMWVSFARGMASLMAPAARSLARQVLVNDGPRMKILDVAAGHGLFGIHFARQNPNATIVALDFPEVLEVASENAARAGVLSRFQPLPGDAFEVDLGSDYDIVLISNFLHHFAPATCERFLRKVHRALKPTGRAITLEFVPSEERLSPINSAIFSLVMLTVTPAGDAYTFKELQRMFLNAGFSRSSYRDLAPGMQQVVTSWK